MTERVRKDMSSPWLATLMVPLCLLLGGCEAQRPPDAPVEDVPGAPGSITEEVDREPRPRLEADTLRAPLRDAPPEAGPQDTPPGAGPQDTLPETGS
jgi:hypothetical protein